MRLGWLLPLLQLSHWTPKLVTANFSCPPKLMSTPCVQVALLLRFGPISLQQHVPDEFASRARQRRRELGELHELSESSKCGCGLDRVAVLPVVFVESWSSVRCAPL
ncbi:unnamed protein product [Symbiodinium sp. CCMP2592]|nr:unnamed protein product [Symbiodinium sp. CCMP2592]